MEAWPARGPLAADSRLLRDVESTWRAASSDEAVPAPGRVVEPLYIGDPDGTPVALLRSTTAEGRVLVAAARDTSEGWRLLDAVAVDRDVSWLTLPGVEYPRALAAPDVAEASSLWLRRGDGLWNRLAVRPDGTTPALRALDGPTPLLAVIEGRGASRSLTDVAALDATSVLPGDSPVRVVSPRWGRGSGMNFDEYDAALFAVPALASPNDTVAVLASARTPSGRAVMVETQSASDGQVQYLLAVAGPDGEATPGPSPTVRNGLGVGLVDRGGGRLLVLAAAAPSFSRVEVGDDEGAVFVDGLGPTAVVLPPPAPAEVRVLGKRTNGSVVASLRVETGSAQE